MSNENIEKNYSAADIEILDGLAGVRKRPGMYIGPTNSTGLHHLVWEIVDNAIDEALNGFGKVICITLHRDGSVSVLDEGRGIPVDIHKGTGMPAVQLIFSTLHSGGKFSSKVYSSSGGLHGVGSTATNALSEYCDVTVFRDGKIYNLRFENGGMLVKPLTVIGTTKKHGTLVRFKPDAKIFSTTNFQFDVIASHVQESAFLLKGVKFDVLEEKTGKRVELCYEQGLKEYVEYLNKEKTPLGEVISFNGEEDQIKIEMAFQYCDKDYGEYIYSYANNVRTRDGGTHEVGFKSGITKAVNDYAIENQLVKGKMKLEGNDIREGLTAVISLKMPEQKTLFESQTKQKLYTPEALTIVNNFVYNNFTYYLNEHKEFAVNLIRKCIQALNARLAARKAKDEIHNSKKLKSDVILSNKLTPAQSKDYDKNELFIVEGQSAGGTAKNGRDRLHQAILPLRGKPLNTDSVSVERMLKNEEFAALVNTIGAGFADNFNVDNSHYGKVIIMTDADTDGAHIQTLLITFFYNYMKPLILKGKLFVAMPPLYRVSKEVNHKLVYKYAWDDEGLEKAKKEIGNGYRISRYKGLGEMDASQLWESTMNPRTRQLCKVTIEDPLSAAKEISILMGNDTVIRRQWVEENVNFNEIDEFIDEVK